MNCTIAIMREPKAAVPQWYLKVLTKLLATTNFGISDLSNTQYQVTNVPAKRITWMPTCVGVCSVYPDRQERARLFEKITN